LQIEYAVEVKNKYSALASEELQDSGGPCATTKYGKLVEAAKFANEKLLPGKRKRSQDDPASDSRVEEARGNLFTAKDIYHIDPSEDNQQTVAEKAFSLHATVQWKKSYSIRKLGKLKVQLIDARTKRAGT
jgi:hypothetical protein